MTKLREKLPTCRGYADAKLCSPPGEVLVLVSYHLDPKSLAMTSCVSKSWHAYMSSDPIWQPICATLYPSLSDLIISTKVSVPYRRLYSMAYTAAKRRITGPVKPRLSLDSLIFAIHINLGTRKKRSPIVNIAMPGEEIDHDGVFKFDINVNSEFLWLSQELESLKITWNVMLRDWKAVFTMMECEGKVKLGAGQEGWFSQELPVPGCCSSDASASIGVVADLKFGLSSGKENGKGVRISKVSVGMLSILSWRYVSVDYGLKYLQHFLLPCDV